MLKIITETVKSNKKKVRISRYKEFDNGHVFFDFQTMAIPDAENLAKEMSIKDPNDIYYVKIDDIMNPDTDIRWINGKSYKSSQVKLAGDKPKILIEKQHYRMVVKKESGLNADGFTISIYQGHNKVDGEIYRYGYNASYDRKFAKWAEDDHKKFGHPLKPYVDDIIQDWKEKYNISDDMVDYVQGKNVFKDNLVSESDIKSKNGLKENSYKPTGNHLPQRVKDKANKICSRYSKWMTYKEFSKIYDELKDLGIEVGLVMDQNFNGPDIEGHSEVIYNGNLVDNTRYIYIVHKSEVDGNPENEFTVYFS